MDMGTKPNRKLSAQLKHALTTKPVLQYPDFTKPIVITTDASAIAVGAILSQGKIGQDKPTAYASTALTEAEKNYSTIQKELTAIAWAYKHFRLHLLGRPFTKLTDHKPLTCMFSVKNPSSRLEMASFVTI